MKRRRMTVRRLVEMVGEDTALRLMREWGGHDVPTLTGLFAAQLKRNADLRKFVDDHGSTALAAEEFGISERHAKRIANGE